MFITEASMSDTPNDTKQALLDAERARWLTVKEAAYVLRISPNTLFQAIHRGQVELFAVGKSWRIHVDSLVQCQKKLEGWNPVPVTRMTRR
jgi:excisionase family DNA binding protein